MKYKDAYFLISLNYFSFPPFDDAQYSVSYYGNISFEEFQKGWDDDDDEEDDGSETQEEKAGPALKSVKASGKKKIMVAWKKADGADGYQVQYALDKKFTKSSCTKSAIGTSVTLKNLKKGTKYFIRVRFYQKSGRDKVYSKWGKTVACVTAG